MGKDGEFFFNLRKELKTKAEYSEIENTMLGIDCRETGVPQVSCLSAPRWLLVFWTASPRRFAQPTASGARAPPSRAKGGRSYCPFKKFKRLKHRIQIPLL